jgi:hypothetical protein
LPALHLSVLPQERASRPNSAQPPEATSHPGVVVAWQASTATHMREEWFRFRDTIRCADSVQKIAFISVRLRTDTFVSFAALRFDVPGERSHRCPLAFSVSVRMLAGISF